MRGVEMQCRKRDCDMGHSPIYPLAIFDRSWYIDCMIISGNSQSRSKDHEGKSPISPKTKDDAVIARTMTPKEISLEWGTDAKTLRKFLRADIRAKGGENPGKGQRWAIDARSLKSLQKRFDAWNEAKAAKAAQSTESPDEAESLELPDSPE